MASNFRILIHRSSESLHLKLMGDFDGTSAHELLNVLATNCKGISKAFIHTNCLKDVHDFGRKVFKEKIGMMNGDSVRVIFTGDHAASLNPKCGNISSMI